MKYIKNGKVVLTGEYRKCDLEETLLRALEIIVEKRVDINLFMLCYEAQKETKNANGLKYYNQNQCSALYDGKLTQEEYELLKEILQ